MPAPSRDRLRRPVDISTLFEGAARRVNLIVDEPGLRWAGLSGTKARNVSLSRSAGGNRNMYRPLPIGRVNRTESRGRARGGVSRTPLRDITAIVRAIERRRAEAPQEETNPPPPSNASQLEQEIGESTPIPAIAMKPQPSPLTTQVSNIMADSSSFVTPQKRLLDSIDKVREAWLQEQRKLERTPAAKKAEREKKVRTLMSMR